MGSGVGCGLHKKRPAKKMLVVCLGFLFASYEKKGFSEKVSVKPFLENLNMEDYGH